MSGKVMTWLAILCDCAANERQAAKDAELAARDLLAGSPRAADRQGLRAPAEPRDRPQPGALRRARGARRQRPSRPVRGLCGVSGGRTYADGTDANYKAANALQAQYKITPLAAWAKPYTPKTPPVDANPGISMTDKPQAVILAMGTEGYFNWVAKRMCDAAPAAAADAPMLAQMAKIGIEPCKPFTLATLDPAVQAALKDVPQAALKKIEANQQSLGTTANGWIMTKGLGQYGTDYMKRAVVAAFG